MRKLVSAPTSRAIAKPNHLYIAALCIQARLYTRLPVAQARTAIAADRELMSQSHAQSNLALETNERSFLGLRLHQCIDAVCTHEVDDLHPYAPTPEINTPSLLQASKSDDTRNHNRSGTSRAPLLA